MSNNIWFDGIAGLVVGDALGDPVQFMDRQAVKLRPVTGMEDGGPYGTPAGTWTDDGSLSMATLCSIIEHGRIAEDDIMRRFVDWLYKGQYTPFGQAFDNGATCTAAIQSYARYHNINRCGRKDERSNGNGALMRILPVCIYCVREGVTDSEAVHAVRRVTALTHAHTRSKVASTLYYFMVQAILTVKEGDLADILQKGVNRAIDFYGEDGGEHWKKSRDEMEHFNRLFDLEEFRATPEDEISSSGYVVHTLEAAVWSLLNSDTFKSALLTAVNLGHDSDSVGAVTGGLAGLYYGFSNIPEEWWAVIKRKTWIQKQCDTAELIGKELL